MSRNSGGRRTLIALLLLASVAVWFIYVLMKPFMGPIFLAVVLAIAANPLYVRVTRRVHSTGLAALATMTILMIVVLLPLWLLGVTIAREAREAYAELAKQSAQGGGWSTWLGHFFEPPTRWIAEKTGMPPTNLHELILEKGQAFATSAIAWSGSLLGDLTASVGNGILSLFVMAYLLIDGTIICEGMLSWIPLPRRRTAELLATITESIIGNVYGIAAVGVAQGLLVGIGFWIAGLSAPIMWGSIAAFASLVPIIGPALIWAPAALILLIHGAWGKALFLALWGVLVVAMADNLVRPWVLSGRTEMNTLVVFLALLGGMQAFGFIGIFAGPVIFSVAISVFRMLHEEYLSEPSTPLEI